MREMKDKECRGQDSEEGNPGRIDGVPDIVLYIVNELIRKYDKEIEKERCEDKLAELREEREKALHFLTEAKKHGSAVHNSGGTERERPPKIL